MQLPEFVYSLDGEYFEEWEVIEDTIHSDFAEGAEVLVYKGKPVRVTHGNLIAEMGHNFITELQEHALAVGPP